MKALIDSKEIQVDDILIILFLSVFHEVLQEFSNRFQDFERISDTTWLVAYPHLIETETAPLNLQMELVELKNKQFVKKFKDEEDLLDMGRGAVKYPNLQELAKKNFCSLWKHLREQSRIFKNEIFEEQIPNPIVRQQSGMWTTTHDIQRST